MLKKRLYRSDMLKCALCYDAPCTSACRVMDPAKILRHILGQSQSRMNKG